MTSKIKFCFFSAALIAGVLHASMVRGQQIPQAIAQYSKAWEKSNTSRMETLKSFWTDESIFEDPAAHGKGLVELNNIIEKFWQDFPGASFEMGPVLSKGNFHTWSWKIYDQNKKLMLTGVDFAETNEKNEMVHLIGFW